jgi:hypothetical protein
VTSDKIKFGSSRIIDDSSVVALSRTTDFEQEFLVAG